MLIKIFKILLIPIFLIISVQFLNSNLKILQTQASDFEVFYLAGKQMQALDNPYLKMGNDIVRNPPPLILIFMLLTFFPILIAQVLWFVFSIFAFLIGSYFLFKIFAWDKNWKIWLFYLSSVFLFFPFRYNLGSGQVNNFLFLFLCLTFYFYKQKKHIFSGIFLALSIVLKITPLFLFVPLVVKKESEAIKWTILSIILIFLFALPFGGFKTYQNYLSIPGSFFDLGLSVYTNQSLIGFLARVSTFYQLNLMIYLLVLISSLVIFLRKIVKLPSSLYNSLIIWNISILYLLIFAPFAWQYHFVIIIFPLIATFYILNKNKYSNLYYFILFLSYILIGMNIKNPSGVLQMKILGSFILSHVFWGSVLLIFLNYSLIKKIKMEKK